MPFAKAGSGVALSFQVIGDGVLLGVQPLGRGGEQHMLMHAHALGITTGQQPRARRSAHRRGHHEARELSPLLRNPIDIRRLDRLRPKTAQIAVPLIVGENNDEIGLGSVEGSRSKQKRGQDTGFKKVNWFHGGQFPANPLLRQST